MRGKITNFQDWLLARCEVRDAGYKTPCWLWQLHTTSGYGKTSLPDRFRNGAPRKTLRVHRAAYRLLVGEIPEGLVIDHLCRNRSCCNPAHLEPVTIGENSRRGIGSGTGWWTSEIVRKQHWDRLGITETHCRKGHEATPKNTRINNKGHRKCRVCHAEYMRSYMHARASTISDPTPSKGAGA